MARRPRVVVSAYPHHIIQRGNNRQVIFFTEDDYHAYVAALRQAKSTYQQKIRGQTGIC
jgi:putative transposase